MWDSVGNDIACHAIDLASETSLPRRAGRIGERGKGGVSNGQSAGSLLLRLPLFNPSFQLSGALALYECLIYLKSEMQCMWIVVAIAT